jgi:hypothetical protein
LIFCLDDISINDSGVLKSPTTTVLELIYAFRSFRVCLMKLGALTLGAYRLIIVISFWSISSFLIKNFFKKELYDQHCSIEISAT